MRTNHNESFNIQAWRRTPVFNMLDIRDGYYFALHATSSSRKRRMDASQPSQIFNLSFCLSMRYVDTYIKS